MEQFIYYFNCNPKEMAKVKGTHKGSNWCILILRSSHSTITLNYFGVASEDFRVRLIGFSRLSLLMT